MATVTSGACRSAPLTSLTRPRCTTSSQPSVELILLRRVRIRRNWASISKRKVESGAGASKPPLRTYLMRAKYLKLAHEPASLLLIAICFVLILVPPLVQALHFHPGSSNANHCSVCQAINSSVLTLPLVVVWTALTAIALVPLIVESAPKQHVDQFSLLSRPPPLPKRSVLTMHTFLTDFPSGEICCGELSRFSQQTRCVRGNSRMPDVVLGTESRLTVSLFETAASRWHPHDEGRILAIWPKHWGASAALPRQEALY